ncbi:trypsin-like serine protease [Allokutzneria sp. A3M-2-11 16]|uniref:S1 family peptidase n=1 Tax=Allokutzneria sp. A3M-2-11 16 TaxID=2962043 RepID=UPI0020B7AD21|nr:trypsin-like serine protease [Allokutzneria sp. A3M-2-11 16]MCP3804865.1 trypsin-like serine protease [Allokutzneria sp. A3M-2-11 16]
MRRTISAVLGACALTFALTGTAASDVRPTIIGGHDATETYSFMVWLSNNCGGSLVAPQWIVTATHCGNAAQGRIGSINKNSGGEIGRIDRRIVKPGSDLTLMRLAQPARSTPVRMAQVNPAPGSPIRQIGWGCTSHPGCTRPVILQEMDRTVLPSGRCAPGGGSPTDVCISGDRQHSGCYGDSGGPAIVGTRGDWTLVGATRGPGDNVQAGCGTIGLYTGIAANLPWIHQHITR